MKNLIAFVFILFLSNSVISQKLMTRTGEIKFEASMPAFEEVAATNKTVSCIFNQTNGDFVALVLVKAFKFKVPLMEEHFNENYIESTKFPKATFKGKILNFDATKLSSTKTIYDLEGELTLHGITKKIKTKISLSDNSGKITAISNFNVKPNDYGIEIPSLVKSKVSENVKLAINFVLEAK